MFHLHWPFQKQECGHPPDVRSRHCPCVSYGVWVCNVWSILRPGEVMRCRGDQPPQGCPLLNDSDFVVSFKDPSKLKV